MRHSRNPQGRILITVVLFWLWSEPGYAKIEPYISPGVRIGYVFGKGLSFSGKISLGLAFGEEDKPFNFVNLTYGGKYIFSRKSTDWPHDFSYTEFQVGTVNRDLGAYIGGSFGTYNLDRELLTTGLRYTIFSGALLFGSLEMESFTGVCRLYDFGMAGVLPIPLASKHWNLSF